MRPSPFTPITTVALTVWPVMEAVRCDGRKITALPVAIGWTEAMGTAKLG
jgi:hypothetical protein